jgi:hypothetical protein
MNKLSDRQLWERSIREDDVLGQIRSMLEVNGARVFRVVERIPWGKTTSEGGIPDLFGWFYKPTMEHPGLVFPLHFFIEVKKPGGKLRPKQAAFLNVANFDGVIAFKADSWAECLNELHRRGIKLIIER